MQITNSDGACFFLRTAYLSSVNPENIQCDARFNDEEDADIIAAAFAFAAEQQAVAYLGRSEQSRFMLETKLAKKRFERSAVTQALDYLEMRGFLDNKRFAQAWLRNRMITKTEGPVRLFGELVKRGVERSIATQAIDSLFETVCLEDVFNRATEKLQRLGKSGDALVQALIRMGFDQKMIKSFLNEQRFSAD